MSYPQNPVVSVTAVVLPLSPGIPARLVMVHQVRVSVHDVCLVICSGPLDVVHLLPVENHPREAVTRGQRHPRARPVPHLASVVAQVDFFATRLDHLVRPLVLRLAEESLGDELLVQGEVEDELVAVDREGNRQVVEVVGALYAERKR